jgi:hypothetical protein
MSIQHARVDVMCDKCERGRTYVVNRLLDVRKRMRAEGWDVSTSRDLCPACVVRPSPTVGHNASVQAPSASATKA